nr:hypothetical protein [uncultured Flavobacterium sp.]
MNIKLNYFIIAIFATVSISCSKERKIKSNIETYVQKKFNDPGSYELVDLKLIDTVTESKFASTKVNLINEYISSIQDYLKQRKEANEKETMQAFLSGNTFRVYSVTDKIEKEKVTLAKYVSDSIPIAQKELEKFNSFLNSDKILYYRYSHEYRAKNNLGALIKINDTIRVDEDGQLIDNFNLFSMTKMNLK